MLRQLEVAGDFKSNAVIELVNAFGPDNGMYQRHWLVSDGTSSDNCHPYDPITHHSPLVGISLSMVITQCWCVPK